MSPSRFRSEGKIPLLIPFLLCRNCPRGEPCQPNRVNSNICRQSAGLGQLPQQSAWFRDSRQGQASCPAVSLVQRQSAGLGKLPQQSAWFRDSRQGQVSCPSTSSQHGLETVSGVRLAALAVSIVQRQSAGLGQLPQQPAWFLRQSAGLYQLPGSQLGLEKAQKKD